MYGFYNSYAQAAPAQTPIVLGFSQRVAVETLFRYCAMEKNPFYLEREKRRVEQEARLQLLHEKRGEDLTPLQQIELLKHTFDLRFADAIAAKTLKAFVVAWVLFEAVEFAWRIHCREQHYLDPGAGWFEKKTSFGIKMDAASYASDSPINISSSAGDSFSSHDFGDLSKQSVELGDACFLKKDSNILGLSPARKSPQRLRRGFVPQVDSDDLDRKAQEKMKMHAARSFCSNDDSKMSADDVSPEAALHAKKSKPNGFSRQDVVLEELKDIASPLRKRFVDFIHSFKSRGDQAAAGNHQHAYDFDVIGKSIESQQLPEQIAQRQRKELSKTFSQVKKSYPYTITTWHEYAKKPVRIERIMQFLNYGIKLGPAMILFGGMFWRYVSGNNQTAEGFLDRLFKNFSSEYIAGFGGKDHKKYLLDVLITPLWKKHGGNEHKVCTELSQMGEKLRMLEGALAAGSTNQKTLYSLVMGVHGGVLPFEQTRLFGRINKAFEQGIVNRGIKAALATLSVVSLHVLGRALVKQRVGENFTNLSDYAVPICGALFTYWTLKECMVKAWNYDSSQARKDYDIFLKRLELEKQVQYTESFYWAWFYPMWRAHKRDVLEVEACFFKRVDEVKKLFDRPVPA